MAQEPSIGCTATSSTKRSFPTSSAKILQVEMTESQVQVGVDPEILFSSFLDNHTVAINNGGDEVAADDDTECLDEFGGYFDKAFNSREVSKWQYENFESMKEVADMNAVSKET